MEFHISRQAREKYQFDLSLFSFDGNVILANFHSARLFAQKINEKRDLVHFPEQAARAGEINAMGLLDEIMHMVIDAYRKQKNPAVLSKAIQWLENSLKPEVLDRVLLRFIQDYPPLSVHNRQITALEYLTGSTDGIPNRNMIVEELLMLWITNMNPAVLPYLDLFDDSLLENETAYLKFMSDLHAFFEDIVLIDNLYDPDEIYEFCHEGILKRGMMDGSRYVPYDPEIHYVCFVDNCNLFRASGSEKHTLMEKWVSNYAAAKLAKQYKWTVVNVLQQTLDSDKEQYTRSGASIVKKLEPSLYRLGNNKEISRDHHVMIGMFAPSFYGVDEYHKYKIDDFRHSFRCLSILKNRRGAPRGHIDCLLKHNTFFFEELPHPEKEPERLAEVLREFRRLQGGDNTY